MAAKPKKTDNPALSSGDTPTSSDPLAQILTPAAPIAIDPVLPAAVHPKLQPPSLGRIVHFAMDNAEEPTVAIVTRVHSDAYPAVVDLTVFFPAQMPTFATLVVQGNAADTQRRWFWPERV